MNVGEQRGGKNFVRCHPRMGQTARHVWFYSRENRRRSSTCQPYGSKERAHLLRWWANQSCLRFDVSSPIASQYTLFLQETSHPDIIRKTMERSKVRIQNGSDMRRTTTPRVYYRGLKSKRYVLALYLSQPKRTPGRVDRLTWGGTTLSGFSAMKKFNNTISWPTYLTGLEVIEQPKSIAFWCESERNLTIGGTQSRWSGYTWSSVLSISIAGSTTSSSHQT